MKRKNKLGPPATPETCPVCDESVPRGALACPECGADHSSGWRLDANTQDALGESDEDFDYEEFVRNEFGAPLQPRGIATIWWVTALFLFVALALFFVFSR